MSAGWPAVLDATLLALLGALHVYWALGGPWGADVAVPTRPGASGGPERRALNPKPLATCVVALLLFAAAAVLLGRVGWLPLLPGRLWVVGVWVLVALFGLRAIGDFRYVGFFKRVHGTRFARWDSALFSPLCLLIAGLAGMTAWLAQ